MKNNGAKEQPSINSQAFYNIMSTVVLSGINFFTIPIFTRVLGTVQYGKYALFHSWITILMCFMGLQTTAGMGVGRYKYQDDYYRFKSCVLLFASIICVGIVTLGIVFSEWLGELMKMSQSVTILLFLTAFSQYIVSFAQGTLIYEKKAKLNCFISVILCVATIGLSFGLTKVLDGDKLFLSRVYGTFFPYGVVAVVLWLVIYLKNPSILVREYCKFALIMGLPMVIHDLSRNLLTQSDRVMMQYMGTTEAQIGIYSFFYSYTNIVMTILTALNTSWCPFYYDDLHAGRFCAVKKKSKNYISLFTAITCGFILLSREVAYIFASEEYWSGMPIIPILVSATYFTFMYQFAVNFEFFNKKNTIVGVATCIAAVLNIVLNWILIPRYGMYGAALATALSYAGLVAVHYIAANRIKVMKFHAKLRDFVPGVIAVGVSSVLFYVLADCWVIRWVIGAAIGVMALIDIVKRKSIF